MTNSVDESYENMTPEQKLGEVLSGGPVIAYGLGYTPRVLREKFGWTGEQIGRVYTPNAIKEIKRILKADHLDL